MELIIGIIVIFVIIFLIRIVTAKDKELEREVDSIVIINDPKELIEMGYELLINIKRIPTSIGDPRPGAVIRDFKSKGYDLAICPIAYDIHGKRRVFECNSLWGKLNSTTLGTS